MTEAGWERLGRVLASPLLIPVLVALIVLAFLAPAYGLALSLVAWSWLGVILYVEFVRPLLRARSPFEMTGKRATVTERLAPGAPGTVRCEGELWRAEAEEALEPGEKVRVVGKEGLVLRVERE